ncbi:putative peroxidase, partial [Mycena polygramma]
MKSHTLSTLALSLVSLFSLASGSASAPPASPRPSVTCPNGELVESDRCCVWYDVLSDLQDLFDNSCGEDAHDALRLSFHDAIGYSPWLETQGQFGGDGADGSMIKFASTELEYHSNQGLASIVYEEMRIADNRSVSYGDMIQFAAAVSVRNCPGGPRLSFFAGRPNATQAAPDGLVPEPFHDVDTILARVLDAGLMPTELVALLASHSIGVQEHVDPSIENTPFDTTPGVFDTAFYKEVLRPGMHYPGKGPRDGNRTRSGEVPAPDTKPPIFRLQSDYALSRDPRTEEEWKVYSEPSTQLLMTARFAAAMARMALIGQDPVNLVDCSGVVP